MKQQESLIDYKIKSISCEESNTKRNEYNM